MADCWMMSTNMWHGHVKFAVCVYIYSYIHGIIMYKYVCVCVWFRYMSISLQDIYEDLEIPQLKCSVAPVHPHHSRLRPKLEDGSDGITTAWHRQWLMAKLQPTVCLNVQQFVQFVVAHCFTTDSTAFMAKLILRKKNALNHHAVPVDLV